MGQVMDFLVEDKITTTGSDAVVADGFNLTKDSHKAVIQAKYDRIKKAEEDRVEAIRQNEIRKENRRQARIKREKDKQLLKFKNEIEDKVVNKGEAVATLSTNLVDIHGNY